MVELEAVSLDSQFQARARRRECPLLLLPVEWIEDRRPRLPRRLVDLRHDQFEPAPPAVDPLGEVRRGDRLRTLAVAGMEGKDRRRVVVGHPRRRSLRPHLRKPVPSLLDPILGEEHLHHRQSIVVGERLRVRQFPKEAVGLGVEAVVDNLALRAELKLPGVDERCVFKVLEAAPSHWVDREEPPLEPAAKLAHEAVLVRQPGADRRGILVHEAIRPEEGVEAVASGQSLGHRPEHLAVFHPPGDEIEIEALDVVRVEVGEHLLVGPLL